MTSSGVFDVGDAVPLVYTISDTATVVLTITAPSGETSTPSTVESGAAPAVSYSAAVGVDEPGVWSFLFLATGNVTDSEGGTFYVQEPPTLHVYTTLPEVKGALAIPVADTADDDDVADAIETASRMIDGDCDRHFFQITEIRTMIPGDNGGRLKLRAYMDLVAVETLKTNTVGDGTWPTTWLAGDYQLLCADGTPNTNAAPEPQPFRQIRAVGTRCFPYPTGYGRQDLVQINGTWGWPAVPRRIRRAARLAAVEVFKLKDAPLGAAGIGDLGIIRVRSNPKYQELIHPYRLYPVPVA